ncbi:hypothetical protein Tco_0594945 [Tanacetum coccineum]
MASAEEIGERLQNTQVATLYFDKDVDKRTQVRIYEYVYSCISSVLVRNDAHTTCCARCQKQDLWMMSALEESRGVNLAWIIVDHLYKHAPGTKENSVICVGHYVTRIACFLGYCMDDEIKKCSEPIDCEYWTSKMLADELDEENTCLKKETEIPTQAAEGSSEQRQEHGGGSYGLGGDDYFTSVMPDFGGSILGNAVGGSSREAGFNDDDDMDDSFTYIEDNAKHKYGGGKDSKICTLGQEHVVWIGLRDKKLIGRRKTRKSEDRMLRRALCRTAKGIADRQRARLDWCLVQVFAAWQDHDEVNQGKRVKATNSVINNDRLYSSSNKPTSYVNAAKTSLDEGKKSPKTFVDNNGEDIPVLDLSQAVSYEFALAILGILSWFSSMKPWHDDFMVEERLVWLEIEGVPLRAWENNTFKSICSKWGEVIFSDDFDISHIYALRIRELCSLTPKFVGDDSASDEDVKNQSIEEKEEVHEENEVESIADIFDDKMRPSDPFDLAPLINKTRGKDLEMKGSETLVFPPGFTPTSSHNQHDGLQDHNLIQSVGSESSHKVLGDLHKSVGFSLLERLEETIKVGLALGLNMKGCENTLAALIANNGERMVDK